MSDIKDELIEILDGATVSVASLVSLEAFRGAIAFVVISLIGAGGYGIISAVERSLETVMFMVAGLFTALKRTIPRRSTEEQNTIILASLGIFLLSFVVMTGSFLWFQESIRAVTFLGDQSLHFYYTVIGFGYLFLLVVFVAEVLKSYKEITYANLVQRWIGPLMQLLGIIGLAAIVTMSTERVLYAMAGGLAVALLYGCYLILQKTSFSLRTLSFNRDMFDEYLAYLGPASAGRALDGVQFGLYSLLMFILLPTQAGIFGIALIFATLVRLPLTAINQIFPQIASEMYAQKRMGGLNDLFQSTSKLAFLFSSSIAIVFIVFHAELAALFSDEYAPYAVIIVIMVLGQLIAVICGTVGYLILMTDNVRENVILQIFLTIIIVAITIPLTLRYDVYGLALSYAIGFALNNLVELVYLKYREDLMPITSHHICLFALYLALAIVSYCITVFSSSLWISTPLVLLCCGLYMGLAVKVCLTAIEIGAIRTYIRTSVRD